MQAKVMIDRDKLVERKALRKVVYKKRDAKLEKVRGKDKRGCENILKDCAPLRCIRVYLRP